MRWLREEFYLVCHRNSPLLTWRGLWQSARVHVWIQAVGYLLIGALVLADVFYRLLMWQSLIAVSREALAGAFLLLIAGGLLKLLISRVGV